MEDRGGVREVLSPAQYMNRMDLFNGKVALLLEDLRVLRECFPCVYRIKMDSTGKLTGTIESFQPDEDVRDAEIFLKSEIKRYFDKIVLKRDTKRV